MSFSFALIGDLKACFALRHRIAMVEQGVPVADEIDALGETAQRLLRWDMVQDL